MTPRFHLVIPCFHESGRIGAFLEELCEEADRAGDVSILVVEDGSGEAEQRRMLELVGHAAEKHPCLKPPLLLPANVGKGGAVHAGWRAHQGGDWLAFVDADGSCSATETMRLMARARALPEPGRAFFASRVRMLGRRIERHLHRYLMGRLYADTVAILLGIPVHDSQCGLKLVPRTAYERVATLLEIHGFGFDIELLAALVDSGCPVEEVPIDWHEVQGGKLKLFRDALAMFGDILKVRRKRRTPEWRDTMVRVR